MKSFNLCARADPLCHARLLLSFLAPQFTRVRIGVVVSAFLSGTAVHAYVSEVLEARVRTYLLSTILDMDITVGSKTLFTVEF